MINKKGMSLVEVIITFSLTFIILIGLYNLIMEVKTTLNEKEIEKNISDFSSYKVNEIEYKLINDKPFAIIIKKSKDDSFTCTSKKFCKENESSIFINYKKSIRQLGTKSLNEEYCHNIYPCAIYFYREKNSISNVVIALNSKKTNRLTEGILYGKGKDATFEKIKNSKDLIINSNIKEKEKNVYIEYEDNMFIINFPYYLKNDTTNYGFKIAYPVKEE